MKSKKYKRPARKHRMDKHPLPASPPNWEEIQQWPRLLMMRNATNLQARRKLLPSASNHHPIYIVNMRETSDANLIAHKEHQE